MSVLVVIGDMIDSRNVPDRSALQQTLQHVVGQLNQQQRALSPYTITLGDEFQALPANADTLFIDAMRIQAALYPVQIRFSVAIGQLSTPINPKQALGMDGPAFHSARNGIDILRKQRGLYHISGLPGPLGEMANASLPLLGHHVAKWKQRRLAITAALGAGNKVSDIATSLGISEQAVYKSISEGAVDHALALFEQLTLAINRELAAT